MNDELSQKAHCVKYPNSADGRGSTRVHYLRRPYYLGPFESPHSYIMFGLWKYHLLETGVAPETKKIRKTVADLLNNDFDEGTNTSIRQAFACISPALLAAVVAALFCGILFGVGISSTREASFVESGTRQLVVVDDVELTDMELESVEKFVRGLRHTSELHKKKLQDRMLSAAASEASDMQQIFNILKDGNRNALHRTQVSVMGKSK